MIRYFNAKQLPEGYPVDEHFNPVYNPWDQRLCAVPDADMFKAIRDGRASVVTDRIVTFTELGILLESGTELEADIIITATGLNLQAFGGIALTIDGEPVNLPDTVAYKSMMLSGVPNFAFIFGYTNSSWTLKVGPLCEHFCRLLANMDAHGHDTCIPEVSDPNMVLNPYPCEQATETLVEPGKYPNYIPGKNPLLADFAARRGIPPEAINSGSAEAMYPDYIKKMKSMKVLPKPVIPSKEAN